MIKFIGKYLGIGILFGAGISIADAIYFELHSRNQIEFLSEELEETSAALLETIYQPGYLRFWEDIEGERPEALLTFNLESAKILENQVQVSGELINASPMVWSLITLEVEVFDAFERLIAECNETLVDVPPGAFETIVIFCPFSEGVEDPELSEISFRVIRNWRGDKILPPTPDNTNQEISP